MGPYSETDVSPMILISVAASPFFGFVLILFMFAILTLAKLLTQISLNQFQSFLIAIAGLIILRTFYPEIMGLGTSATIKLTTGSTLLLIAVAILFGKIIATALSLGFGFFGDVFFASSIGRRHSRAHCDINPKLDGYTIISGAQAYTMRDGSCCWNGYWHSDIHDHDRTRAHSLV